MSSMISDSPDYCDVPTKKDTSGDSIWPAPNDVMERARRFLLDCAQSSRKTLIVPDKDADGLSAGVIIHRTLTQLGLDPERIEVHLIAKHSSVHDESERKAMEAKIPDHIVVVDQGSRGGPPLIDKPCKALLIDHHLSDEFPAEALSVSACHYPPVATSALLTYEICQPLHPEISPSCKFLCAIGTHGDLGGALKWKSPFPDMQETFKLFTKKSISQAVSLINAPRRTAGYNVALAWEALLKARSPRDLLGHQGLVRARQEINEEVEFRTHTPPKFSKDGKFAVLRIHSVAQVHGPIATRWAGYLRSSKLQIVMVANSGYLTGHTNFSCRIARSARGSGVNIIEALQAEAAKDNGDLVTRLGHSFARGHAEASGGIVPTPEFERLMALMGVGEKVENGEPQKPATNTSPAKRRKLDSDKSPNSAITKYFKKK